MSDVRVQIGDDEMRSTSHGHVAQRTDEGWVLSWLPDRTLDRNQAITGMILAEMLGAESTATGGPLRDLDRWVQDSPALADQATAWAGELGASMSEVVALLGGGSSAADAEQAADTDVTREYEQDVDRAVQLAADEEVDYSATGDVVLLRDPYDILARAEAERAGDADAASGPAPDDGSESGWGS